MACNYTGSAEQDLYLEMGELRDDNGKLTKMLCEACKSFEYNNRNIPPGIYEWWKKHKEQDAK